MLPDLACTLLLLLLLLNANAFPTSTTIPRISSKGSSRREKRYDGAAYYRASTTSRKEAAVLPDPEILEEIKRITIELWGGEDNIPTLAVQEESNSKSSVLLEGEADLPEGIRYEDRGEYFKQRALIEGCPKSQHSYGLLLWNGFAKDVTRDAKESAKFHAAAAYQNHLDGIAVLGGCLRTGTGLLLLFKKKKQKNVALGLKLIDYCASVGNPSGVNKKAALFESNHQNDYYAAVELYEKSLKSNRINALLLFNLGWCLVNGQGVDKKDVDRGIELWKQATEMAPDEGSEEAAWHLYQQHQRDNPTDAKKWLDLAEELGYYE